MIYIIFRPLALPCSDSNHKLLLGTLDLNGIPYELVDDVDKIANGSIIITDCFAMETPLGDPQDRIARRLIDEKKDCLYIFYIPHESNATLSASYFPTAEFLASRSKQGYLIHGSTKQVNGFVKTYDILEYFAWTLTCDFNSFRLHEAHRCIDNTKKIWKFLCVLGEQRGHRDNLYNHLITSGLDRYTLLAYWKTKHGTGIIFDDDWNDLNIHPDFKFYAYRTNHHAKTEMSIVSETTLDDMFITEKTFKCLMLGHPFFVQGSHGILDRLKQMGFKTFSNVIDESYDAENLSYRRLPMLYSAIEDASYINDIDSATKEQNKHNRRLFFDVAYKAPFRLLEILREIVGVKAKDPWVNQELVRRYLTN